MCIRDRVRPRIQGVEIPLTEKQHEDKFLRVLGDLREVIVEPSVSPSEYLMQYGQNMLVAGLHLSPTTATVMSLTTVAYGLIPGIAEAVADWINEVRLAVNETSKKYASVSILGGKGRMTSTCLLYTSPSPRDGLLSRMPSSA